MSKPVTKPRWADVGGSIVTPNSGKQDIGWVIGEKPPAEYMNWLFFWIYQWVLYLDGLAGEAFTWTAAHVFSLTVQVTGALSALAGLTVTNSTTNGHGVTATGNGSGRGVFGTGGASNGVGVYGFGGATNGYGGYFQGVGSGGGLQAIGGSTNGAGIIALGTGTGVGISAQGGSGGSAGQGGVFQGGSGEGVNCTGGAGQNGGIFTGGSNATAIVAIGTGTGRGITATGGTTGAGGSFTSGGSAAGIIATCSTPNSATAGTGNGITIGAGPIEFQGTQPAGNVDLGKNKLCGDLSPKAWVVFHTDGAGGVVIDDRMGVTSVTVTTTYCQVTFARAFASTAYCTTVSSDDNPGSVPQTDRLTRTTTTVRVSWQTHAGGAVNPSTTIASACLVVFGKQ